ncbi:hypothetical protein BDW42DRAFT_170249 [Aspergillus taichungensis]|uniref:Uncharacterized protein n=1 Tax=Aspergillus taichungensis TaxID=482145 RepID=A0A2J5HTZ6_9EURO|nr:hypothetical protein BDW42DRAFT_170249 [Aspergillus taichungensis]
MCIRAPRIVDWVDDRGVLGLKQLSLRRHAIFLCSPFFSSSVLCWLVCWQACLYPTSSFAIRIVSIVESIPTQTDNPISSSNIYNLESRILDILDFLQIVSHFENKTRVLYKLETV